MMLPFLSPHPFERAKRSLTKAACMAGLSEMLVPGMVNKTFLHSFDLVVET